MSHGPEEHLEHAEHAHHAAHDPFMRRVAMSMAIVAAILACLTMLSHREHNETLRFQTEANIQHTLESDQWGYYQAKKTRQTLLEMGAGLLDLTAKAPNSPSDAVPTRIKQWQDDAERYKREAEKIQEDAKEYQEKAREYREKSEHIHHRANRFDLGELGTELALVLCSVAVLTRSASFWYAGIFCGILGVAVAATGFFLV